MSKHDIDKAYISPHDLFFHQFDKTHPPTLSQQLEKIRHDEIAKRRDIMQSQQLTEQIWRDF